MDLIQQVKGNYSDSREEEEEEEVAEIMGITREAESSRLHHQDAASNFGKKLDLMELSLGSTKEEERERNLQHHQHHHQHPQQQQHEHHQQHHHEGPGTCSNAKEAVEKEQMFEKVVTPSDVGKLNRLVIPKQHAEKYFPLDSSSNEKGLLLNFEDRNGKVWRFRYSYWNSSQSYVMTKGWSRFVKEKKLDAGDTVSFQRGLGDMYRHRLYIDWRRRTDHAHPPSDPSASPLFLPSIRWYSLPATSPIAPPRYHHDHHFHHLNYSNLFTFQHQHQYLGHVHGAAATAASHHHNNYGEHNSGSGPGSLYYLRSMGGGGDQNMGGRGNSIVPMIIDSVPVNVGHHNHRHGHGGMASGGGSATTSSGKRLRLFGVNMECASSAEDSRSLSLGSGGHVTVGNSLPSSSSSLQQRLRIPHEDPLSSSARFGDHKGGSGTSLLFDLDPSLQ
ncbi:hypothetical protein PHAVU_009G260100 [Phaseolus vulgaris]|uniref:TF-B3 domain-containing protein n=1 Tax=Phaseolus vulgaris TaxID=3885 RepID=V7B3K4_PHAVU|nr:hypothetical protein PHAVU_009G260100g [Phaseolus vulgaris]ESW11036.1 hypothetical protein PHAVU_009G260100g [Phaseolus vulgaris]